jgi:hypothetical protein
MGLFRRRETGRVEAAKILEYFYGIFDFVCYIRALSNGVVSIEGAAKESG